MAFVARDETLPSNSRHHQLVLQGHDQQAHPASSWRLFPATAVNTAAPRTATPIIQLAHKPSTAARQDAGVTRKLPRKFQCGENPHKEKTGKETKTTCKEQHKWCVSLVERNPVTALHPITPL